MKLFFQLVVKISFKHIVQLYYVEPSEYQSLKVIQNDHHMITLYIILRIPG